MTNDLRSTEVVKSSTEGLVSRRRLVRAGLAAAPVMAVLKSNTVLAAHTCIKPSSFASLQPANWTVSRGRTVNSSYTCFSHGYWKNVEKHPHPSPYNNTSKSYFQAAPILNCTGCFSAGFSGDDFHGMTLLEVLNGTGNANNAALARHLVATFLTAVANGDNPNAVLLTTSQCRTIWTGNGVWSPAAGINWTLEDTMEYFEKIYGAPFSITSL